MANTMEKAIMSLLQQKSKYKIDDLRNNTAKRLNMTLPNEHKNQFKRDFHKAVEALVQTNHLLSFDSFNNIQLRNENGTTETTHDDVFSTDDEDISVSCFVTFRTLKEVIAERENMLGKYNVQCRIPLRHPLCKLSTS